MHKYQALAGGLALLACGPVFASGSVSGGPVSGGYQPRAVDEVYEFGKAVFKGRAEGAEKIKYCVMVDGKAKKLKRSTAKPYRNGPARDFALALVDCSAPERLALTTMAREHVPMVLYYLNKRFKLDLVNEPSG